MTRNVNEFPRIRPQHRQFVLSRARTTVSLGTAARETVEGVPSGLAQPTVGRALASAINRAAGWRRDKNDARHNPSAIPRRNRTMRTRLAIALALLAISSGRSSGQATQPRRDMGGGRCSGNAYNCADAPNPLAAPNTVWLEEMTWMDARDAIKGGKTTVIIPTGGFEPNGPWLALGKHNYVLQANCEAIARKMGNTLCAPIIKLVPEGRIDPPSGHMASPGTISLREETFRAMLTDVVHSLKMAGFKNI